MFYLYKLPASGNLKLTWAGKFLGEAGLNARPYLLQGFLPGIGMTGIKK
jgi:hypothetical protein